MSETRRIINDEADSRIHRGYKVTPKTIDEANEVIMDRIKDWSNTVDDIDPDKLEDLRKFSESCFEIAVEVELIVRGVELNANQTGEPVHPQSA
jgi:hypothetical protein